MTFLNRPAVNHMVQHKPPSSLLRGLSLSDSDDTLVHPHDIAALPAQPGAYALILHARKPISLAKPKALQEPLVAGWYIYAGSARGPGGIGTRVSRHLRRKKPIHWHIDQLTTRMDVRVWAIPFPDRTECDLVSEYIHSGCFLVTHSGFGSSDCRLCAAHLLMWRQAG